MSNARREGRYRRRIVPAAVATGALLIGGCEGASSTDAGTADLLDRVVVNEVMSRNQSTVVDPAGEVEDWVELYNPTAEEVDLGGYGLSDNAADAFRYVFPAGTILGPSSFLLVWLDGDVEQGSDHASFGLGGDGEVLLLTTADGERLELITLPPLGADQSIGRFPDGSATFEPLSAPTPGTANRAPGLVREDGAAASGVVINELMAANAFTLSDEAGEFDDWVELFNTTGAEQDLTHHYLSDDPAVPKKWRFPDGTTIAPGAFLVVWVDDDVEQGPLHATFKLSADGESVVLAAPDGELLDSVGFPALGEDVSYGRLPDGTGQPAVLALPSPGAPNGG